MNITPIGERVVLERIPHEETVGGIYIPESVRRLSNWVRVKALGTGRPGFEFTVKVGDKVLIPKLIRTDVEFRGENILIMPESELLAVIPT